jgi:RsiW-degrading membrane proteinase PrsW (M82 family)
MESAFNLKTIFFLAIGGILPSILWLWFWLKEDRRNPEPKSIIIGTFILGGLLVLPAYYLEQLAAGNFDLGSLETVNIDFSSVIEGLKNSLPILYLFLAWALIEEFLKFLAAGIFAFTSRNFDEPVDAMIYMITSALGFAALENSLFLNKTLRIAMSGFDLMMNGNLRFLGATLLHVFCSALVGGFIGLSLYRSKISRFKMAILGVLVASILHALFNFFIIVSKGQNIFKILIALWIFTLTILVLFEKIKKIKTAYVQR